MEDGRALGGVVVAGRYWSLEVAGDGRVGLHRGSAVERAKVGWAGCRFIYETLPTQSRGGCWRKVIREWDRPGDLG